ncbi:carbamoyl-phosphate synthase large subunit [Georgenia soli]|uniref:Carbamoyl-phosphate synthase large subunit n=1 Tax=Georgenia soli TaxID=638953 RepID=A0A2A9EKN8_9MICO|nr:ATP-grasp domain-containing protein [Georgenia soli]PFG39101.1 carbamoyl-phosphate synthase large subunit [Georgenia soli]
MTAGAGGGRVTVVIGSAGRRLYLIEWFRDALARLDVDGEVVATEHDPTSASFGFADRGVVMPAYSDAAYAPAMLDLFERARPALFVSVNDYELQLLSEGLADRLRATGCAVAGLSRAAQEQASDKYLMARLLGRAGVAVPRTELGSRWEALVAEDGAAGTQYVVKHRFGSGSSGLRLTDREGLAAAVDEASGSATDIHGRPALRARDAVVVQRRLMGQEFGVDGVFGLGRETGVLRGTLARRKMRMRSGETDKAVTVDPAPFAPVVARLGAALRPAGPVDLDLIRDRDGVLRVIDVNPRFGGGYPFMHVAGADAPTYLLAAALGRRADPALLRYQPGVVGAKYESIRRTGALVERATGGA